MHMEQSMLQCESFFSVLTSLADMEVEWKVT